MRVAIPLFGTRVSPRCLYSDKTLLVQVRDNAVISKKTVDTTGMNEEERIAQLVDLEIDLFVCGAIDEDFVQRVDSYGIKVVQDVAAEVEEVLTALTGGQLRSGYGLESQPAKPARKGLPAEAASGAVAQAGSELSRIDCVECVDRLCLKGENCMPQMGSLFPADGYSKFNHSMEVTMDISAETHRKLCRVAEFIYYCMGMEYKHIGVAFCVEMFREAEILTRLLRRFFRVSPVCCKVGGHAEHDLITASSGVVCNPIGQACVLNRLGTEVNVVVGLCVGVDFIFTQHSEAPTSTLFVKDKSLANNPVSALFSKYYIEDILGEV
ncbi:MAG: DUF1847 domain-containing protein [Candidatus Abyssobacteria bacterium SURF_17]|uniref:DUF1847 domain-containing protein n=1 Tax=Candidatus Abyssobacteria bacterium SURF_17 TaxID=2093361 RepID=A0A419EPZ2_9BACT|nr:MAG: DUF1847 domain-containing protein [Candidatus Abyssubacteria bacterium SURF_17]